MRLSARTEESRVGYRMPLYMGEIPSYDVRGDHMHIVWRELELVLPVPVMLAGMASAQEAIAKWGHATADNGSVIPFKPR